MALRLQTERAAARIEALLERRRSQGDAVEGVRIGIKARGCNGLSYTMDYATEKKKLEEEVNQHGASAPPSWKTTASFEACLMARTRCSVHRGSSIC